MRCRPRRTIPTPVPKDPSLPPTAWQVILECVHLAAERAAAGHPDLWPSVEEAQRSLGWPPALPVPPVLPVRHVARRPPREPRPVEDVPDVPHDVIAALIAAQEEDAALPPFGFDGGE